MPKIGAEPERRQALVASAIEIIGEHGSLDVSVKEIARHAGMSSALAFHYFGGKDEIIVETMRYLLRVYSRSNVSALTTAETPAGRIDAIILASFGPEQFEKNTIAAWLVFYLHAYSSAGAARLLAVYHSRLKSNLVFSLSKITSREDAGKIAEGLGSLIDGIYIRQALRKQGPSVEEAITLCRDYVAAMLENSKKQILEITK